MDEINNSTVNFTTPEASTNFTTNSFDLITRICVYSISFLFGLPTHSYVIWLIITGRSGVASEFLNLNCSLCEIGVCLKGLFNVLSLWSSSFTTLSIILQGIGITGRPLFQCLICVERYLAVVHPVTFLKFKPLRYRVICSTTVWIITCGSCLFCWLISISLTSVYTWFILMQFLLFLFIQLFCCMAVLRALKQSGPGERGRKKEEENYIKRRAFHLILITTVSLAIIYVPFIMTGFIMIFTQRQFPALRFASVCCYVMAGFVQPVLFLDHAGKLPLFSMNPVKDIHCNVNNVN